ncbi:hypothetical protein VP01_3135g4 [Puccinia sorghi]|uniref:Uncharacterized protein n=1 Tax=Puccinia sorghi TaxID=27349 RepID=A0A0L6UZ05_9BASI|nr:hypothetical protein VP01_3135g4 [Puccinia sorghi]
MQPFSRQPLRLSPFYPKRISQAGVLKSQLCLAWWSQRQHTQWATRLSTNTQNNVINSENEDNAQLLWKAILKRFISSEPSNCARVYNQFSNISFYISNIGKFITEVRSILVKMEDVGIKIEEDIITYDLINRLPSSLDNIKQQITHSVDGNEIKPETLLHHLKIHLNELKVLNASQGESIVSTMYTNEDQQCTSGTHLNSKTHTKDKCWVIYPEKRIAFLKKREESNVSNFSTFSSHPTPVFILDSSSSSHMVSNFKFFTNLDKDKGGVINTSCGLTSESCKSRTVVKITKALFKHQSSSASKAFEELHLDLNGPINPLSATKKLI